MWHRTVPNELKIQENNHTGRSSFGKSVDIFGNGEEAKVTEQGTKEKGKIGS